MFIAEPRDRKPCTDTTPSDVKAEREQALDRERREFIRAAAIGICERNQWRTTYDTTAVWLEAQELWDARPEDC